VAEVLSDSKTISPYLKRVIFLFNFVLAHAIIKAVNAGKDKIGLAKKIQRH